MSNPVFAGQGTTIFTIMSALAVEQAPSISARDFPTRMDRWRCARRLRAP